MPFHLLRGFSAFFFTHGMEPFRFRQKLVEASKNRPPELNNVVDYARRISFFVHKRYDKFFLAPSPDVLSSVVTSLKRFDLKISSFS